MIYNVVFNFCCTVKWLIIHIYILFHILFHCSLLHDIEYSSLCYTVGPCCYSIQYIIVCICWSQTPNPTLLPTPTWQPQVKTIFNTSRALENFIVTIFHSAYFFPILVENHSSHSLVIKFVLSGSEYLNFSHSKPL